MKSQCKHKQTAAAVATAAEVKSFNSQFFWRKATTTTTKNMVLLSFCFLFSMKNCSKSTHIAGCSWVFDFYLKKIKNIYRWNARKLYTFLFLLLESVWNSICARASSAAKWTVHNAIIVQLQNAMAASGKAEYVTSCSCNWFLHSAKANILILHCNLYRFYYINRRTTKLSHTLSIREALGHGTANGT